MMMAHPSAVMMNRRRWALLALRAVAMFMIVYGGVHILRAFGSAFGYAVSGSPFLHQLLAVFYSNNYNAFWYGLSFALPGFIVGSTSRRFARWLVPADAHECPACGYALQQLTTTRCPECGFSLGGAADQGTPTPR